MCFVACNKAEIVCFVRMEQGVLRLGCSSGSNYFLVKIRRSKTVFYIQQTFFGASLDPGGPFIVDHETQLREVEPILSKRQQSTVKAKKH